MFTRPVPILAKRAAAGPVPRPQQAAGFSIVEVLVGLAMGLASMLVVYQLYSVSEKQRRTVSAISGAQSAGALALFSLERDILSAGLGFAAMEARHLGCSVQAYKSGRTPEAFQFPLVPVRITNGGTELWVLTGSSANMVSGARYEASANSEFKMEISNAGLRAGDIVVGTSDSDTRECLMLEVTAGAHSLVSTGTGHEPYPSNQVRHALGDYPNYYTGSTVPALRNGGTKRQILDGGPTNLGEGALYNLGTEPQLHVWSLKDNALVFYNHLDETSENKVAVAQDVLRFQAEYGYDLNGNGQIDNANEWTTTFGDGWTWDRVLAVRVATLVRSSQFERDAVTTEQPRWANGSKTFGLSDDDWQHYRYRVYESVIPLRNTLWGQTS